MPAKNTKHLSLDDRMTIQDLLDAGATFTQIANVLGKHRTTISREVHLHRFSKLPISYQKRMIPCIFIKDCHSFKQHKCSYKDCPDYKAASCQSVERPPYVCNACHHKGHCKFIRYFYSGITAHNDYLATLSASREGIDLDKATADEISRIIAPLIKDKKQSVNQVYINHPDLLHFSKPTFYKYVNEGAIGIKNIDLPRKVRYKPRKKPLKRTPAADRRVRIGRTYQEYQMHINNYPDHSIVQMDTVIGKTGSNGGTCFLTMLITSCSLLLIFPITYKRSDCITEWFVKLREMLGDELYHRIFRVFLTDNGSEFMDPLPMEANFSTGEIDSNVFYCDPYCSWQKGALEKCHEYIRYVFPKGSSFAGMSYEKCCLLASHINSVPRVSLGNKTPYEVASFILGEPVLEKLNIKKIKKDDVCLSSSLIK